MLKQKLETDKSNDASIFLSRLFMEFCNRIATSRWAVGEQKLVPSIPWMGMEGRTGRETERQTMKVT